MALVLWKKEIIEEGETGSYPYITLQVTMSTDINLYYINIFAKKDGTEEWFWKAGTRDKDDVEKDEGTTKFTNDFDIIFNDFSTPYNLKIVYSNKFAEGGEHEFDYTTKPKQKPPITPDNPSEPKVGEVVIELLNATNNSLKVKATAKTEVITDAGYVYFWDFDIWEVNGSRVERFEVDLSFEDVENKTNHIRIEEIKGLKKNTEYEIWVEFNGYHVIIGTQLFASGEEDFSTLDQAQKAYIYTGSIGGWQPATPYIYTGSIGSWQPATPYIWGGSKWK